MAEVKNLFGGDEILIVGHKRPDLDAVVSAFGYEYYRHSQGDFDYVGVRCDEVNEVTKWAFKKFGIDLPPQIDTVAGRKVVLVDHTDPAQRPDGWKKAEIIEVFDHHKVRLETSSPPKMTVRPYGSTATLIVRRMLERQVNVPEDVAGLLLAAILDDTLALQSPISTYTDKLMAGRIATFAGIPDLNEFTQELFKAKDVWHKMSAKEIYEMETKEYEMSGRLVHISQVETLDNEKLLTKKNDLLKYMREQDKEKGYYINVVMLTDLLKKNCVALVTGENGAELEKVFEQKFEDEEKTMMRLPGVTSRKKQMEGPLEKYLAGK